MASFGLSFSQAWAQADFDFQVQLSEAPSRIAFGSCNDLNKDAGQGFWNSVLRTAPQAWVWNGDIVYPDNDPAFEGPLERWLSHQDPAALNEMEDIRARHFQQLKTNVHYKQLTSEVPVFGSWDDHDYAYNNADGSYAGKEQSKQTLLRFLDVEDTHPIHSRAGVYHSVELRHKEQSLHLIVLDLRSGSDFSKGRMLSEEQWQWLQAQFSQSTSGAVVLFSALTVENDVPPKDNWYDFPEERKRLRSLILNHPHPVAVVSGDLHYASFTKIGGKKKNPKSIEFTSSGMTHLKSIFKLASWTLAQLFAGKKIDRKLSRKNFGEIQFNWDGNTVQQLKFKIRSTKNGKVLRKLKWTPSVSATSVDIQ